MSNRTIVMLRLDLQDYLWRALLNQALPELGNNHLGIWPAQEGNPCKTELFEKISTLCDHLAHRDTGTAVVNLRFGDQLEHHGSNILSLVKTGASLFVHSRDSELLGSGIGRELASCSRAYEASPIAPGKEPSEKQQAWLDLLGKLGISRPPCMIASMAHDFMGKISSLQLALHSMEQPDGRGLILALRNSMSGGTDDVRRFFLDLTNIFIVLKKEVEFRLKTSKISEEDRAKVELWLAGSKNLMGKLGRLVIGESEAGSGIENDLMVLRRSLNSAGSVRL